MDDGWDTSAAAWIDSIGTQGDWSRRVVLDPPMLARIAGRGFTNALDIGCGEGRFCRTLRDLGIAATGIDPTTALIDRARALDPAGDYRVGKGEELDVESGTIDLAISYLSLIDIPDVPRAIAETRRVLRDGGTLLIANLQSFATASPAGWTHEADGTRRFCIDDYLDERSQWVSWQGIRIRNWHRPLSTYMNALLSAGFELRHFAEPEPIGPSDETALRYRRVPYLLLMEWQKVAAA